MERKIYSGGNIVLPDRVMKGSLVVEGETIVGTRRPGVNVGSD